MIELKWYTPIDPSFGNTHAVFISGRWAETVSFGKTLEEAVTICLIKES